MRPRLRHRLIQTAVLSLVVAAGFWGYTRVPRPDPAFLADYAETQLREIFGPGVKTGPMDVDLIDGVIIPDLEVSDPRWPGRPTLTAKWVKIEHDLVALASGVYVPTFIHIQDATAWVMETESGIRLAFPFELKTRSESVLVPSFELVGGRVNLQPLQNSKTFRPDPPLTLDNVQARVFEMAGGRLRIEGSFEPVDLGYDGDQVNISGWADLEADRLELGAVWDGIEVNEALLARLAPDLAVQLEERGIGKGTLTVALTREPRAGEGEIEVSALFQGTWADPLKALPDSVVIDATTREQIAKIFRDTQIDVRVSKRGLELSRLVPDLPDGKLRATGFMSEDGSTIDLTIVFEDARFEDATIRKALGPEGQEIYDQFDPSGKVEVSLHIHKEPGSDITWDATVTLTDVSFRYKGKPWPDGTPRGFPYAMEQAAGVIEFSPGLIEFGEIVGYNGGAMVRILGHKDSVAWTGGETGIIRLTDEGADIRLTVDAEHVLVDDALQEAIDQSGLKGLLDRFIIEGFIDRIQVDILAVAGLDPRPAAPIRIDFSDERFTYKRFPMKLEGVTGYATLLRPRLPDGSRGRDVLVDVSGTSDGAPVSVHAAIDLEAHQGRLRIEARDVPLEGEVTRTIRTAPLTGESMASIWNYLDPRGRADVLADLPLDESPDPLSIRIRLHDASVRLDADGAEDPIEVTDIEGTIRVLGDLVTLENLEGRLGEHPVRISGTIRGGTAGEWNVHIETDRLRLDPALLAKLPHYLDEADLLPAGLELESGGHLVLTLDLHREPGEDQKLEATILASEIDARLRLGEGRSVAVRGESLTVVGGQVKLEGVRAKAPGLTIDVESLTLGEGPLTGTFRLSLDDFTATDEILRLAPEGSRPFLAEWLEGRILSSPGLDFETHADGSVKIDGTIHLVAPEREGKDESPRGELILRGLVIESPKGEADPVLHGRILFKGFSLGSVLPVEDLFGEASITRLELGEEMAGSFVFRAEKVRILGIRTTNLVVPIRWRDGILHAAPIQGLLSQGRLQGQALVHTRPPLAYEGEIRVEDFQVAPLREDLAPGGAEFSGRGRAFVRFENRGGKARDLVAEGQVQVREGDLGNLPGIANLEALFASILRRPNPPKFERAHADFVLRDGVIHFRELHLAGPLFDLPGRGSLALDGSVDLVFKPHMLKSLFLPGSMQLPGVAPVLRVLLPESLLYAIRLRGDLNRAEPQIEALPALGLGGRGAFEGTGLPEPRPRRIPRWFR